MLAKVSSCRERLAMKPSRLLQRCCCLFWVGECVWRRNKFNTNSNHSWFSHAQRRTHLPPGIKVAVAGVSTAPWRLTIRSPSFLSMVHCGTAFARGAVVWGKRRGPEGDGSFGGGACFGGLGRRRWELPWGLGSGEEAPGSAGGSSWRRWNRRRKRRTFSTYLEKQDYLYLKKGLLQYVKDKGARANGMARNLTRNAKKSSPTKTRSGSKSEPKNVPAADFIKTW